MGTHCENCGRKKEFVTGSFCKPCIRKFVAENDKALKKEQKERKAREKEKHQKKVLAKEKGLCPNCGFPMRARLPELIYDKNTGKSKFGPISYTCMHCRDHYRIIMGKG